MTKEKLTAEGLKKLTDVAHKILATVSKKFPYIHLDFVDMDKVIDKLGSERLDPEKIAKIINEMKPSDVLVDNWKELEDKEIDETLEKEAPILVARHGVKKVRHMIANFIEKGMKEFHLSEDAKVGEILGKIEEHYNRETQRASTFEKTRRGDDYIA